MSSQGSKFVSKFHKKKRKPGELPELNSQTSTLSLKEEELASLTAKDHMLWTDKYQPQSYVSNLVALETLLSHIGYLLSFADSFLSCFLGGPCCA